MSDKDKKEEKKPKVGVFVCHCGGNISDVIDVKKVAEEIKKMDGVVLSTDYVFMCSDPGQNLIYDALKKGEIDRVVVAACSPRLHELTFRRKMIAAGTNPYLLEQANIREQGSWVHHLDKEGATEKAIRLVKAAVNKVKLAKPLDNIKVESLGSALVIGGGIAGLRTAIDLAEKNIKVYLVEKTPFLGGNIVKLDKLFPYEDDPKEIFSQLINKIKNNKNIEIFTNSEILNIEGYIGNFKIKIKQISRGINEKISEEEYSKILKACPEEIEDEFNYGLTKRKAIYKTYNNAYPDIPVIDWNICTKCGKCKEIAGDKISLEKEEKIFDLESGSIIIATGFNHYEPYEGEYGYKKYKEVITLPQLIRILDMNKNDSGELKINGRKIKNIGFMHCVGSRQIEGVNKPAKDGKVNDYCSRVCCTATLQTANELKKRYKNINVFDFYQDIRTYGRDHETNYYETASKNKILFFKYDPYNLPEVYKDEQNDKLLVKFKDILTQNEEVEIELDLLVLSVGMMPSNIEKIIDIMKLPVSSDRFLLEMHPKLRPVETAIGGVFLAGTSQAPMDSTEATEAASSASVKASIILQGGSVALEPYVAKVNENLCKGHGECIKACHYKGAIYMVEKEINGDKRKIAEVNPALCKGCGACVAVCPEGAIDVEGYEIKQFEAMIDAIAKE